MRELNILTTETDLTTHDISKMGDFFYGYISNMKEQMESHSFFEDFEISPATAEILSDIVRLGVMSRNGVQYIADFGNLPLDIQKKFRAGKLIIQNSNKVTGNSCPFLVDPKEPEKIVANLTLKKVRFSPRNMEMGGNMNIATQMQLKQISEKLDCIDEKINFQMQRDRERDLTEPFFTARDYIRDAQVTRDESEREKYLYSSVDYLKRVYQAAYHDLETSSKWLADNTKNPVFMKHKEIRKYMVYMCEDIYMMNKSIGLQLQIFEYQEKKEEAWATFQAYVNGIAELSEKKVGIHGESAMDLLQDYYPYNKDNRNMWINFANNIKELKSGLAGLEDNSKLCMIFAE